MTLPTLTTKQLQILHLIYRYRFLNRIQLQAFLGHKDKRRIGAWLKDLRDKHYLEWVYSTDFVQKTIPARYYLGLNGVRHLRASDQYPPDQLRKRYREASRQTPFISRCLTVADCALDLIANTNDDTQYSFVTESDYTDPASDYNFLSELGPHLCISKCTKKGTQPYLVEIFDATLPRYRFRKRLSDYFEYLDDEEWQSEMDGPAPVVLLVCPTLSDLIYAKRRIRRLLEDTYNSESVQIRFSTAQRLRSHCLAEEIWESA